MRKRKKEAGLFDWLLLALAVSLAAIILYFGAERWRGGGATVSLPPPPPLKVTPTSVQPLAGAQRPAQEGVSESFLAPNSIPPMVLSRTGRPSVRTKAPPAPKTDR
ncbi:MAG: hypothetical protein HY925_15565 [Elusimicrobia bacterium]|nr:hypothetical protein [Elusimicrobiota bacterium]